MRRWTFAILIPAMAAIAIQVSTRSEAQQAPPFPTQPPTLKLGNPLPANLFVELAKAVNPAIVNISTSQIPRNYARDPMMEMLEQMYGAPMRPRSNKPRQIGLGTGFVIREDGLIVTNAHVVRAADIVNVQFDEKSDKVFEAKIVGSDERSDIALLKIQPDKKLTPVVLGTSKNLEVGEWVAAFGNPFGHGHTMTKGVISSKGREIGEINKYPLLQTDASINPGNSGGPLINTRGEVIGVNSAIDARAQGIGFAIPIDEVKRILPDLETRGRLRKGYLGVGLADIYTDNEDGAPGVGVVSVDRKAAGGQAGLRPYDTITEFNGKKVRNMVELMDAIADTAPGTKTTVKVLRQEGQRSKNLTLELTVGERPEKGTMPMQDVAGRTPKGQKVPHDLGFTVSDLNADLRTSLELGDDVKKPVIVSVDPNSMGSFVGLRPGDILLEVNRTEVSSAADVIKHIKKGDNSIKLARGNRIMIVTLSK